MMHGATLDDARTTQRKGGTITPRNGAVEELGEGIVGQNAVAYSRKLGH
jgi:hypothetical protein